MVLHNKSVSYSDRASIKFITFEAGLPLNRDLPPFTPGSAVSRTSTPLSRGQRIDSTSPTDSSSEPTFPSSPSTGGGMIVRSDSLNEHSCSRCRMTDEEARKLKAERRREQNRASQRRFRAKKENEIRGAVDQVAGLESTIQDLQIHNMELEQTNLALKVRISELENQQNYCESIAAAPPPVSEQRCSQCHKASIDSESGLMDIYWPVNDVDLQQAPRLGTFLPLFDHELLPCNV